jgi:hypothetical protein
MIQMNLLKELSFDNFEWKVISPRLYRLISQNNYEKKGKIFKNNIIGIPAFIDP